MKKTHTVASDLETQKIGEEFAQELIPGDTVLLHGDLGFGKTTFVKGVGKGLGIVSRIISPTFVFVRKHKTKSKTIEHMYHIDLYRAENDKQLDDIGLREILDDTQAVKFIEWPDKAQNLKPNWEIKLSLVNDSVRVININKL